MNEEKPKTSKSIKKTQPTNLKRNPWKIAFLVLVGLVIGSVAFVTFRATQVREPDLKKIPAIVEKEGEPVVTIQSKKQQVNKLIDFYLADFQKGSEIKYKFYLENDALLNGTFHQRGKLPARRKFYQRKAPGHASHGPQTADQRFSLR